MRHFVVTAALKRGSTQTALALLKEGPPFDIEGSRLERHIVFLGDDQLVFVFEGEHAETEAGRLLETPRVLERAARLADVVDRQPSVPREVFSWERVTALEGVSFGADPGPGYPKVVSRSRPQLPGPPGPAVGPLGLRCLSLGRLLLVCGAPPQRHGGLGLGG
jgi:hypothetical protein